MYSYPLFNGAAKGDWVVLSSRGCAKKAADDAKAMSITLGGIPCPVTTKNPTFDVTHLDSIPLGPNQMLIRVEAVAIDAILRI